MVFGCIFDTVSRMPRVTPAEDRSRSHRRWDADRRSETSSSRICHRSGRDWIPGPTWTAVRVDALQPTAGARLSCSARPRAIQPELEVQPAPQPVLDGIWRAGPRTSGATMAGAAPLSSRQVFSRQVLSRRRGSAVAASVLLVECDVVAFWASGSWTAACLVCNSPARGPVPRHRH